MHDGRQISVDDNKLNVPKLENVPVGHVREATMPALGQKLPAGQIVGTDMRVAGHTYLIGHAIVTTEPGAS